MKDNEYYRQYEPIEGVWYIKGLIGQGSYGKVFRIEREEFGHVYTAALKVMTIPSDESELKSVRAEGMSNEDVTAHFRGFVENIANELAIMSDLKGNSNIVSYLNHVVVPHKDGVGWDILIRMELLTTLTDHIAANGMSTRDVTRLGVDICRALELCQKRKLIHRDIKPENIFISDNGDYKLGDFGIARTAEKTRANFTSVGTVAYMAPEVYSKQPYGVDVDIYSLGMVLYRLLNDNRLPFLPRAPLPIRYQDREEAQERRMRGDPLPRPAHGDDDLCAAVLRACAYRPEERYASASELRRTLEALLPAQSGELILLPYGQNAPAPAAEDETEALHPSGAPEASPAAGDETELLYHRQASDESEAQPPRPRQPILSGEQGRAAAVSKQPWELNAEVRKSPDPPPQPPAKASGGKKSWKLWLGVGAGVIAAAVLLLLLLPKGNRESPAETPGIAPPRESGSLFENVIGALPGADPEEAELSEPAESAEPAALEWSEWTERLPRDITDEDYAAEEKLQYRTATLRVTPGSAPVYGDWTPVGGWVAYNPGGDGVTTRVETRSGYRYRDNTASVERQGSTWVVQTVPGPWIDTETMPAAAEGREIQSYTLYQQYRRQLISAGTPAERQVGSWGAYSDDPAVPGDTLAVSTRPVYRYASLKEGVPEAGMDNFPAANRLYRGHYTDVDDSAQYAAVALADALRALVADEELAFRPEDELTVGEAARAAVVLYRTYRGLGNALPQGDYIAYAVKSGMVGANEFRDPSAPATGAALARLLCAALPPEELAERHSQAEVSGLDPNSDAIYYDSVSLLMRAGVLETGFDPWAVPTRAQAAAYICRMAFPDMRV